MGSELSFMIVNKYIVMTIDQQPDQWQLTILSMLSEKILMSRWNEIVWSS